MQVFNPQQLMKFQVLFDGGLAILLLLARLGAPATAREVARQCGIAEHTAGRHLQRLLVLQLIQPADCEAGYLLAPGALDDLLPAPCPPEPPTDNPVAAAPSTQAEPQAAPTAPPPDVKINHLPVVVVNTQPKNITTKRLTTTKTTTTATKQRARASPDAPRGAPEAEARAAVRQALAARGILEPKRSQLAQQSGMNLAYLEAWERHLQNGQTRPYSTGLLIHLLEQGEPPPESAGGEHPPGCSCKACLLGSYLCTDCQEYPCQCPEAA